MTIFTIIIIIIITIITTIKVRIITAQRRMVPNLYHYYLYHCYS